MPKIHKTTKAEFNRFKKTFEKYQRLLGLTDWIVYFRHENLNGAYARIGTNTKGRVAVVTFCDEMEIKEFENWKGLELDAKHEALHLMLADLDAVANVRYTTEEEINIEEEKIVRRLEKLI